MRVALLSLIAFLIIAPAAMAQTHPCDSTATGSITANQTFGVGFCHNLKDTLGDQTIITQVRVVIDGAEKFKAALSPTGTMNAAGDWYFQTPTTISMAAGSHNGTLFLSNSDGESPGVAFSFTILPKPAAMPSTPTRIRVVRAL